MVSTCCILTSFLKQKEDDIVSLIEATSKEIDKKAGAIRVSCIAWHLCTKAFSVVYTMCIKFVRERAKISQSCPRECIKAENSLSTRFLRSFQDLSKSRDLPDLFSRVNCLESRYAISTWFYMSRKSNVPKRCTFDHAHITLTVYCIFFFLINCL